MMYLKRAQLLVGGGLLVLGASRMVIVPTPTTLGAGLTWGPDQRLTTTPGSSLGPSIAISSNKLHVLWNDDRDGNREIYYKKGALDLSVWDPDVRITNSPENSVEPAVATSGTNVHI